MIGLQSHAGILSVHDADKLIGNNRVEPRRNDPPGTGDLPSGCPSARAAPAQHPAPGAAAPCARLRISR